MDYKISKEAFLMMKDNVLEIIRVLHQQMDIDSQLNK